MVRQLIRVSLLVFWLGSSPTDFHEASKSLDINLKVTDCYSHIPRGHTSLREDHRRSSDGKGHSNLLVTTSWFYTKSGKICVDNNTKDQSFRFNSRFDSNDIVTYPREIRKNTPVVMGNVQSISGVDFRTCEINRPVIINSTSSPPSQIASSFFAAKKNTSVAQKLIISTNDRIRFGIQTRAALVDSKFTILSNGRYFIQSLPQMIIQIDVQ